MKFQNRKHVILAEAGIQQVIDQYTNLKPLDYEIHPCISPCGPAIGCSNLLMQFSPAFAGMRVSGTAVDQNPLILLTRKIF